MMNWEVLKNYGGYNTGFKIKKIVRKLFYKGIFKGIYEKLSEIRKNKNKKISDKEYI